MTYTFKAKYHRALNLSDADLYTVIIGLEHVCFIYTLILNTWYSFVC